jgi:hypothetical protein
MPGTVTFKHCLRNTVVRLSLLRSKCRHRWCYRDVRFRRPVGPPAGAQHHDVSISQLL